MVSIQGYSLVQDDTVKAVDVDDRAIRSLTSAS
jgi:hypothetical protein